MKTILMSLALFFISLSCQANSPTDTDSSFGVNGISTYPLPNQIAKKFYILPNSKILVLINNTNTNSQDYILRVNSGGFIDTTYGNLGKSDTIANLDYIYQDFCLGNSYNSYCFGFDDQSGIEFIFSFDSSGIFNYDFNQTGYFIEHSLFCTYFFTGLAYQNTVLAMGHAYYPLIACYTVKGKRQNGFDPDIGFYSEYSGQKGSFYTVGYNIFNIDPDNVTKILPEGPIDKHFGYSGTLKISKSLTDKLIKDIIVKDSNFYLLFTSQQYAVIMKFDYNGIIDDSFGDNGYLAISGVEDLDIKKFAIEYTGNYLIASSSNVYEVTTDGVLNTNFGVNGVLHFDNTSINYMQLLDNQSFYIGGQMSGLPFMEKFKGTPVPPIYLSNADTSICQGEPISVPLIVNGVFQSDNVFTLELSDEKGSFVHPYEIGTLNTNKCCNLTGNMPQDLKLGNMYQIRVKSSDPVKYSNQFGNITINQKPVINYLNGPEEICTGETADYKTAFFSKFRYKWTVDGGKIITTDTINTVSVVWDTSNEIGKINLWVFDNSLGCPATESLEVIVHKKPAMEFDTTFDACADVDTIIISGAKPAGGKYFGTGLKDSIFQPLVSGPGDFKIYYTFRDSNQCSDTVSTMLHVHKLPQKPTIIVNKKILQSSSLTRNQWFKNGSAIDSANEQDFTVTESATYTVQVSDEYGCISAMSEPVYIDLTDVPLDRCQSQSLMIIPNPASDFIQINVMANGHSPLQAIYIYNTLGEQVIQAISDGSQTQTIDISNLPAGLYFVRCGSEAGMFVKE